MEIIVHRYFTALTFPDLIFLNCNFIKVVYKIYRFYISGACFTKCQIIRPKFYKMLHLSTLIIYDSKIQKLKKWIIVDCWDNVEEIINKLKN